jgi:diguanylate cyclase (GGDEF)-like protein
VLVRAVVTTAIAVVASLGAFGVARWATGVPSDLQDLVECIVIPIVVGMPIASYVFAQSDRLKAAFDALAVLNAETARAHNQLKHAHEMIAFAAHHDRMTGLLNRERFLELLERAHVQSAEDVFLLIDADHFKQINDAFGHLKGDEALVKIAQTIMASVRSNDEVGRLGGEEFGVLLRSLSVSTAADMAENIRRRVEQIPWEVSEKGLSVSIGGAALKDHHSGVTEVLGHADRCLYRAKRSGRNCIAFNHALTDIAHSMARLRDRQAET